MPRLRARLDTLERLSRTPEASGASLASALARVRTWTPEAQREAYDALLTDTPRPDWLPHLSAGQLAEYYSRLARA
ncbi:hypothetical protein [Rubricoccus marinus]|uniref:Uncharacterized protein n=1 Tax=Rubricoccus marinus TaxID=716817 RepID=A0A259TXC4_9BACT|nr:hypothetical protein [Rubricoccus marinus]OZC02413.1 hypothetical protein BSZ36_05135 [Rubricoccus marinus]